MRHRREYDSKLVGRNLKRLREKKNLSVEDVREYLCLGSVQAIYKYEAGRNYPQTDVMFALLELYEADFRELLWEQLTYCRFSKDGCWVILATMEDWPEILLEVTTERNPVKKRKSDQFAESLSL
ncbi:MAG: helix-turn-helix domain-containing protein [Lachnospiraceae bacterium]